MLSLSLSGGSKAAKSLSYSTSSVMKPKKLCPLSDKQFTPVRRLAPSSYPPTIEENNAVLLSDPTASHALLPPTSSVSPSSLPSVALACCTRIRRLRDRVHRSDFENGSGTNVLAPVPRCNGSYDPMGSSRPRPAAAPPPARLHRLRGRVRLRRYRLCPHPHRPRPHRRSDGDRHGVRPRHRRFPHQVRLRRDSGSMGASRAAIPVQH
ncbi:hypothetical protein C8R46DRAFT_1317643 [Mycena filopes]|nr:hypothetical protein C8R46DRAFT_1317643 [Mycena filopes]